MEELNVPSYSILMKFNFSSSHCSSYSYDKVSDKKQLQEGRGCLGLWFVGRYSIMVRKAWRQEQEASGSRCTCNPETESEQKE